MNLNDLAVKHNLSPLETSAAARLLAGTAPAKLRHYPQAVRLVFTEAKHGPVVQPKERKDQLNCLWPST